MATAKILAKNKPKSDTLHVRPDIVVGVEIRHITLELSTQHSFNNLF